MVFQRTPHTRPRSIAAKAFLARREVHNSTLDHKISPASFWASLVSNIPYDKSSLPPLWHDHGLPFLDYMQYGLCCSVQLLDHKDECMDDSAQGSREILRLNGTERILVALITLRIASQHFKTDCS